MELRRHSRVLPSNAPALLDSATQDLSRLPRVLQERSSNRQHDFLDTGFSSRRKHIPSSPTENFYSNGLGAYLDSYGDLGSPFKQDKSESEIDRETAILWRSLQRSEAYRKYRAKQPKDSREQEQKWPEHMEYAFFRGLVRYEPMGRRKMVLDGKQRGRNELVADAIQRDTGEARSRKQVSSHIQVLKTLLKVLKYMSKEDLSCRSSRHSLSEAKHTRNRHMLGKSIVPSSKYDNYTQPTQLPWEGYGPLSTPHMLMDSPSIRCSNTFKPFDFEMFVRDPHQKPPRHLHTFTKLPKDPKLQVIEIDSVRQWQKLYPELAFMFIESYHDCEVIVCDASLQLMTERIPAGAELAIQLEFTSEQNLSSYDSFDCRTRFYDSGKLIPQTDDKGNPIDQTSASFSYDPTSQRLDTVPFGSSFWAYRLAGLAKMLREARNGANAVPDHDGGSQPSEREKVEYRVRQNLQRLTAVQEIYARPKGSDADTDNPHRILAILWRFRQTTSKDSSSGGGGGGQTT
ncbi:TEA-domain-containing protein, partial [Glonium stellatum]